MRPYRGIPIDGKDFVYGWYVKIAGRIYIAQDADWSKIFNGDKFDWYVAEGYFIQVIPETVGQQVGLKDKNGTEAYKDDEISAYGYSNWVINWHNNGWKLKQIGMPHWKDIPIDFIITGSIHQEQDA